MQRTSATRLALAPVLLTLITLVMAPTDSPAQLASVLAVAAMAVMAVAAISGHRAMPVVVITRGRAPALAAERRLRGAFRRQSAPDTPGCPRIPRAPGRTRA